MVKSCCRNKGSENSIVDDALLVAHQRYNSDDVVGGERSGQREVDVPGQHPQSSYLAQSPQQRDARYALVQQLDCDSLRRRWLFRCEGDQSKFLHAELRCCEGSESGQTLRPEIR